MSKADRRRKRMHKSRETPPEFELKKTSRKKDMRRTADKAVAVVEADPQRVALAARARHAGLSDSRQNRNTCKAPYMGSDDGLAIKSFYEAHDIPNKQEADDD